MLQLFLSTLTVFWSISFWQKSTNTNCKCRKAWVQKSCLYKVSEIKTLSSWFHPPVTMTSYFESDRLIIEQLWKALATFSSGPGDHWRVSALNTNVFEEIISFCISISDLLLRLFQKTSTKTTPLVLELIISAETLITINSGI